MKVHSTDKIDEFLFIKWEGARRTVRKKTKESPFVAETSCSGNEKLGHSSADKCISCTGNYEIILASRERHLRVCCVRKRKLSIYLVQKAKKKFCMSQALLSYAD